MFGFLFLLQLAALSLSFAKNPWFFWCVGGLVLLYLLGRSYSAVAKDDGGRVKSFWYQVRSIVFILDIVILIALVIYYFVH